MRLPKDVYIVLLFRMLYTHRGLRRHYDDHEKPHLVHCGEHHSVRGGGNSVSTALSVNRSTVRSTSVAVYPIIGVGAVIAVVSIAIPVVHVSYTYTNRITFTY